MGHSDKKPNIYDILNKSDILADEALEGSANANVIEVSLSAFVSCFLDGVGETTIERIISNGYDTFEKMRAASVKDIVGCNIKQTLAMLFVYGLKEHEKEIDELLLSGKIKLFKLPPDRGSSLKGISFCFTGPLETMDRNEAKEKIRSLGGTTRTSVSGDLSFLVTNNEIEREGPFVFASTKNIEAYELGITRISENDFISILENPEKIKEFKKA
jgi:DNA ligase (NAD+)